MIDGTSPRESFRDAYRAAVREALFYGHVADIRTVLGGNRETACAIAEAVKDIYERGKEDGRNAALRGLGKPS